MTGRVQQIRSVMMEKPCPLVNVVLVEPERLVALTTLDPSKGVKDVVAKALPWHREIPKGHDGPTLSKKLDETSSIDHNQSTDQAIHEANQAPVICDSDNQQTDRYLGKSGREDEGHLCQSTPFLLLGRSLSI